MPEQDGKGDYEPTIPACRWHPEAKQITTEVIFQRPRFRDDPRVGKPQKITLCYGCLAESKPSGPTEFAS